MQGSVRRRALARNGVVAGSVWETRMRMDEAKGAIKVFHGDQSHSVDGNADEDGLRAHPRLRRNQSDSVAMERRKRRSWRPAEPAANGSMERGAIQLRKAKSDLSNSPRIRKGNCEEIGEEKVALGGVGNGDGGGEKEVPLMDDGRENGGDEGEEVDMEVEEETKSFDDKEMDVPVEKPPKSVEDEDRINKIPVKKPNNVEEKERINQINEKPVPPKLEKKLMPPGNHRGIHQDYIKPTPAVEVEEEVIFVSTSGTQNRMQNIVNLVMWRDVSKSAFVFGFGTFFLISSSYAKDLNFSLISAISYLALIYLALIFFAKSILRRGAVMEYDEGDERCMVGEEEVIWLLRMLLPYINELLLKLRALFSGDPGTTAKLAVLLFVMARCGGSITIWTLAKLVFFGVFTIPKVYSSYSTQLARYGKFWLERFRDGWETCTHKKAVAAAIFTLIWNLSSNVARIWAVFMLAVAFKFYQQCVGEEWSAQEEVVEEKGQEDSKPGLHRQRGGPSPSEVKIKKGV